VPSTLRNPHDQIGGHDLAACGCIVRLSTGQCTGVIRAADRREVWFHRSDMLDRRMFNELVVGDWVVFDLVDDRISGARALKVRRRGSDG
jgi:cold shock CspA family protein